LAIYKTLNTEPPVSSADLDVEEHHDELDSGSTERVKAAETGEQTFAKSFDNS